MASRSDGQPPITASGVTATPAVGLGLRIRERGVKGMGSMTGVHICSLTDFSDVTIRVGERAYRMDFSSRFGPLSLLDRRGRETGKLPGVIKERSFWDAVQWWCRQGHQLNDLRECVYVEPPMVTTRWWSPDGGRHAVLDTPDNRAQFAHLTVAGAERSFEVSERAE